MGTAGYWWGLNIITSPPRPQASGIEARLGQAEYPYRWALLNPRRNGEGLRGALELSRRTDN